MNYSFHPEADEEFVEGVAYYEDCEPGLGLDFSREVYAAIQNALDYPAMWPEIDGERLIWNSGNQEPAERALHQPTPGCENHVRLSCLPEFQIEHRMMTERKAG